MLESFDTIHFETLRKLWHIDESVDIEDLAFEMIVEKRITEFRIDGEYLVRSNPKQGLVNHLVDAIKMIDRYCGS